MKTPRLIALLPLFGLALGCASPHPKGQGAKGGPSAVEREIQINYVLGHNYRKLTLTSVNGKVTGKISLDRQIVKENQVDPEHFSEYFHKVDEFMDGHKTASGAPPATGRAPAASPAIEEDDDCRSPYTLKIHDRSGDRGAKGCRSGDDGTVSRLIKDGEFLIYSKK